MKRTLIAGLFVGGLLFAAMFCLRVNSGRLPGLPDVVHAADETPIIEKGEASTPRAQAKAQTRPPNSPSVAKTTAPERPEPKKLVSLSEALLPIMIAAEKEAEQSNATEDQKEMAKRYRERRKRLQSGQFNDVYPGLFDEPQFEHPSLNVVSSIMNRIEGAKDEDHLRSVEVRREAALESLRCMYIFLVGLRFDEALEWIRFLDSLDVQKHQPERELVAELVNLDAARRERTVNLQPIAQLARKFHSQLDSGELKGLGTLVGQALRQAPDSAEAERMQLRLVMRLAFLKADTWLQQELSGNLSATFVSAARRRLALGDIEAARLLAIDALPVNVQFKSDADTPSRVLADIEASRPSAAQRNPVSLAKTNDPPVATRGSNEFDVAMDRDAKQLALRVRAAQEPEKSKLRAELEKLTEQHFEHRQSRRDAEIAELSDRVDKLRVAQHRRQENKADIIKRRVSELLDPDKKLEWDEANTQSTVPITTVRREGANTNAPSAPEKSILPMPSNPKPEVEPSVPAKSDAKSDAVTAALLRAAEARVRLADVEVQNAEQVLRTVLDSIQKVPGAVSKLEVGKVELDVARRRSELEVAHAELDAAKAGVDISRTSKPGDNKIAEPTYNNVVLSEWLRRLENERNPEKLAEAVQALNTLASDVESRQLVRATLRMMRTYVSQQSDVSNSKIVFGSLGLLCLAKSDLVVEDLIAEFEAAPTTKLSLHFRIVFAKLLHSLAQPPDVLMIPSNYPIPRVSKDAVQSLRMTLRKNSSRWVTAMIAATERDPELGNWLVDCTPDLLRVTMRPLTDYPELIPHVERAFTAADSGLRPIAARLLGTSNLRIPEVVAVAESWMSSTESVRVTEVGTTGTRPAFDIGVDVLAAIAPRSPLAVTRLTETLRDRWTRYVDLSSKGEKSAVISRAEKNCLTLMETLGEIGEPARGAIPVLREIERSPASENVISENLALGGFGVFPAGKRKTLREKVAVTIQQIEEVPAKPNAGLLKDENRD